MRLKGKNDSDITTILKNEKASRALEDMDLAVSRIQTQLRSPGEENVLVQVFKMWIYC